ncbi:MULTISPECIES: MotA/TolQ/ExbB proton channel family protein [Idiomarina]|uniref:MotA/TolQ/ExbB proton channel family protein n=2 Tax=Idiomarina abyssalis TaxID=86102 RepID=A0A8I1G4L8_9GAMM|nr:MULTISPECIES: MotA/TolQ/ExbB proton channel family protein [Idiomarina]MBJ7266716.1 MotA/TolQ/ExbB proton channel family protein [Idiomarina abyssalis]MBJ7273017.1 MotA/TolQ/ExbB proton channel family protein [Idiomarina abyssalis]MBJ7315639.1 MotA/TolQ/ExbB proton channel family protein [Idiomarina abyssalis]MBP58095.1 biopolymer transporter ExbB [Idiomarina sp.]TDO51893.1 MotA/TolQ/ExbB proton channel family protein [Idiomarina sp. 017G]|tara:strand:- start:5421 stop:6191 length:771 start_codon:yes stop_codon:yes gene_type:complete
MSKNNTLSMSPNFFVSGGVLLAIFTLIHLLYAGLIRPAAEVAMAEQGTEALTAFSVIFKDVEQQVCISLMLFCLFLMLYKLWRLIDEEEIYSRDLLESYDKSEALDVDAALNDLESSAYKETPAYSTWINCIRRFKNTKNVQHAADTIESSVDNIAIQLESGNNMIRYIIWAIPSIGFVGTVRGIGSALAQADKALDGDIAGMTASLGVAFNSTLVALFISLILMLFMHLLNSRQDKMVIRTQESCEKHLLSHLHS